MEEGLRGDGQHLASKAAVVGVCVEFCVGRQGDALLVSLLISNKTMGHRWLWMPEAGI